MHGACVQALKSVGVPSAKLRHLKNVRNAMSAFRTNVGALSAFQVERAALHNVNNVCSAWLTPKRATNRAQQAYIDAYDQLVCAQRLCPVVLQAA